MKRIGTIFAVLFALAPLFSYAATLVELQAQLQVLMAQLSAMQSQTGTVPQGGKACPNLTRNLSRGMRGNDVVQLQQFLITQKFLAADSATGFFGAVTETAVKKFQCNKMNVCSGTSNTNGYGAVGPKTRAVIASACATLSVSTTTTVPTTTGAPTTLVTPTNPTIPATPTMQPTTASCAPLTPQTQNLSCPVGQTGSVTQTRTSNCANGATTPTWDGWQTVSNSCTKLTTLADYWNGKAQWQLEKKLTNSTQIPQGWPAGFGEGSEIVVGENGVWYLFHRHVYNTLDTSSMSALWGANTETERKLCGFSGSIIGTDIRKSTDQGVTWSDPRPVVWPAKGSPWECMGGDGGAYYDSQTKTWQYLFQCLSLNTARTAAGDWNGCRVSFSGADPVIGPNILWDVAPGAIAVRSGSILNRLCSVAGSACARLHPVLPAVLKDIYGEGTFDVFDRKFVDGQWWWYVTMHGFDNVLGYRALTKTVDFVNWKIGSDAADLPNDFIGSAYTLSGWNETWQGWTDGTGASVLTEPWPIGTGAARILKEGDYYYEIIEATDKNLVCVAGQKWDIGILRTNNLSSPTWEQLPQGNPIFKSSELAPGLPCSLSYANIFRSSDGVTYLHMHVHATDETQDGLYIYRLTSK